MTVLENMKKNNETNIEKKICPQCGLNMSKFSAKHFGMCNNCKDKNWK